MATVEELRAQIKKAELSLRDEELRCQKENEELKQAFERHRLRRNLSYINNCLAERLEERNRNKMQRSLVDEDRVDSDERDSIAILHEGRGEYPKKSYMDGEINVAQGICKGEYVWTLKGMSWLQNAMAENNTHFVFTPDFWVGPALFELVYAPGPVDFGWMNDVRTTGSLAIRHRQSNGIIFRYTFFIKRADGEFVQWGETRDECHPGLDTSPKPFGPDVQTFRRPLLKPFGIFGLSHHDLLKSEWIEDDALTVKVQTEVMQGSSLETTISVPSIAVPPPCLGEDLMSLLSNDRGHDLTFVVEGRQINAHSLIVSARSQVLDRELKSGMRESLSKVIEVHGIDADSFGFFLDFLYHDDLNRLTSAMKQMCVEGSSANNSAEDSATEALPQDPAAVPGSQAKPRPAACNPYVTRLQKLLSISDRYQVNRLSFWLS
jgi:hypothetical protein